MSTSDLSQNSSIVKGLDSITAKKITQEIKEGIEEVRNRFLSKRKKQPHLEYKNVSAMVTINKTENNENISPPLIERAQ